MEHKNINRSLMRGLHVLTIIGRLQEPTLSNIARESGLAKSTTSRFLNTLLSEEFLDMDGSYYRLAPKVLELGFAALRNIGISESVATPLQAVADLCLGASNLARLDRNGVIIVARRTYQTQKQRFYSMQIDIGTRLPGLFTATGRILLGHHKPALEQEIVKWREHSNTYSLKKEDAIREAIAEARERNVATIKNQLAPGFGAVAIGLKLPSKVWLAFSGSYLLSDHNEDVEDKVLVALQEHTDQLYTLIAANLEHSH